MMKEYTIILVRKPDGPKPGELLRKNMRGPHFKGRKGKKFAWGLMGGGRAVDPLQICHFKT